MILDDAKWYDIFAHLWPSSLTYLSLAEMRWYEIIFYASLVESNPSELLVQNALERLASKLADTLAIFDDVFL